MICPMLSCTELLQWGYSKQVHSNIGRDISVLLRYWSGHVPFVHMQTSALSSQKHFSTVAEIISVHTNTPENAYHMVIYVYWACA